jgi:putative oxidoreductase
MNTDRSLSIGLLILRIGIAGYMATHGWGKLQMVLAGQYEMFGDPIGIGSRLSLLLVMFAEFICALLVLVGAATRLAAIPVVITMCVAAFVAHGNDPWTMTKAAELFFSGASKSWASKQTPLMFAAVFLALIFTGAGRYSVDGLLAKRRAAARS